MPAVCLCIESKQLKRISRVLKLTITIEISIRAGCENLKLEEVKDITALDWREKNFKLYFNRE